MGIDPIGYKPWTGARTTTFKRTLIITKTFFLHKLKSWWILSFLIIGWLIQVLLSLILILMPHETLDSGIMPLLVGNIYFFTLIIILVSLICSETVSEDIRSNSFVLYFSRSIKVESFLVGKMSGAFLTLSLLIFIPPVIIAIALMGTQTGSDYLTSMGVLALTIVAGFVGTVFLLPFGVMVSALTKRKSYAAIWTFMILFSLSIIGGIFSFLDANWLLLSPEFLLYYFYEWLFGEGLPSNIDGLLLATLFFAFMIIPLAITYLRLHLKAVGK